MTSKSRTRNKVTKRNRKGCNVTEVNKILTKSLGLSVGGEAGVRALSSPESEKNAGQKRPEREAREKMAFVHLLMMRPSASVEISANSPPGPTM